LAFSERLAEVERRLALSPAPPRRILGPDANGREPASSFQATRMATHQEWQSKLIGGQRLISEASLRAYMEQLDD
jgi:hypothetical protein